MQTVLVGAVRFGQRGLDGNVLLRAEVDHLAAAGKRGAKLLDPPRSDHSYRRIERLGGQLEPALVVALARGAVSVRIGADLAGHLQANLRDQRPGDRSAQQVDPLVLRLPGQHRKGEIAAQFLARIDDLRTGGPARAGFVQDRLTVLARLPQVDVHRVDVVPLVLQPAQDDRGVQPAGIR